jgi:hypothetical protein
MTAGQGMFILPIHFISPPVSPGVRVSPLIFLTCNANLCFKTEQCLVS